MTATNRIAIIGAGPVGLAAAAHALERGWDPVVLEAGPEAGHAIRQWAHVRMFSPWEYNIDKAAGRLLAGAGWNAPDPQAYPTGAELIELYISPLAKRTDLASRLKVSAYVTAISRDGFDRVKTKGRESAPFEVRYRNGIGDEQIHADAVIDTSGTWFSPNPAGANGLSAIGEQDASGRIAYGMPDVLNRDRARYANKTVAVLGSGHSAIGTLLELVRLAEQAPGTKGFGFCGATGPRRRLVVAPMTNWQRAASLARGLPNLSVKAAWPLRLNSRSHTSRVGMAGCALPRARHVVAGMFWRTNSL